jgi:hypothetical protein
MFCMSVLKCQSFTAALELHPDRSSPTSSVGYADDTPTAAQGFLDV